MSKYVPFPHDSEGTEPIKYLFQEEYLTSCYWRTSQQLADVTDKYDSTKPYYEMYKVDFDQFKTMFLSLSPWAKGQRGGVLALRAFRVSVILHYISYFHLVSESSVRLV